MRPLPLLLGLALVGALPLASAQNDTTPTVGPGAEAFGPEESLEGPPGIVYGVAILVGTVAVAATLAIVSRRQRRREP